MMPFRAFLYDEPLGHELEPCPKCGVYYPRLIIHHNPRLLFGRYHVECWRCGFSIRPRISRKSAIKTWNKLRRICHG